jgi:hypothetical protein
MLNLHTREINEKKTDVTNILEHVSEVEQELDEIKENE